ncbi:MAG: M50 family metallopeptidase, partial [Candidatus Nanoarchaeia archaeon]
NLKKIRYRKQLAIFSAGPFANVITAFIFLLILNFATGPMQLNILEMQGITVNEILPGYPAEQAGMTAPVTITAIDGQETLSGINFTEITSKLKPNQTIVLETEKGNYIITTTQNPDNASKGFMGVGGLVQKTGIKKDVEQKYGTFWPKALLWTNMLLMWLFVINLGIGIFNLLPLGPVDGGRMFYVVSLWIFKDKKRAMKAWALTSFICISLIIVNLIPWLNKLLNFILNFF